MKKCILVKDQLIELTFDEVYQKFQGLTWKLFKSWRPKIPAKIENDDIIQEIRIALWDAYSKYDASKGAAFTTYATLVINSMFWHMTRDINIKKRKAYLSEESLNAKIKDTDFKTEIIDNIEAGRFEDDLITKIRIEESLELLNERDKTIITMITAGISQTQIAKHLGKSQAEISRLNQKIKKTLVVKLSDVCV